MSKTTITINGEECVILPAPKGAFILRETNILPCYIECMVIAIDESYVQNVDGIVLLHNKNFVETQGKQYGEKLKSEIFSVILENLHNSATEGVEDDVRNYIIGLYRVFKSHKITMDISAGRWFDEKFKEHNITKADFDVFA